MTEEIKKEHARVVGINLKHNKREKMEKPRGHRSLEESPAPAKKARRDGSRAREGSSGKAIYRLSEEDNSLLVSMEERLKKLD